MDKLLNISQTAKVLDLINAKTKKPNNHVLRYWEKEFKIIKPKIINKRRYYTSKQVEILRFIKFLLRNKGVSILGVKKILKLKANTLDDYKNYGLKEQFLKSYLKTKSNLILEKINKIKFYGKKNTP